MSATVILKNGDEIKGFLARVGRFANICKSSEEKNEDVYKRIGLSVLNAGHFSASRDFMFRFMVDGCSRVCSHQLVRHSIGVAINQASGVFQVLDTSQEYIMPKSIAENEDARELFRVAEEHSKLVYNMLIEGYNIPRSDARYIIGQGSQTAMNISFTLEALINLANERLCSHAQWEIQDVTHMMVALVAEAEPELSKFFYPKCVRHGACMEEKPCTQFSLIKERRRSLYGARCNTID